jgi:hypothetical protein
MDKKVLQIVIKQHKVLLKISECVKESETRLRILEEKISFFEKQIKSNTA